MTPSKETDLPLVEGLLVEGLKKGANCTFDGCPYLPELHVILEKGCVCYPNLTSMHLCCQHWIKLEPLGWAIAFRNPNDDNL